MRFIRTRNWRCGRIIEPSAPVTGTYCAAVEECMNTPSWNVRKHLGLIVAAFVLPGAVLAAPAFADGSHGGGGHAFSGGHVSSAPHFSGGGHAGAPHYAAPHYAARSSFGGYAAGGYGGGGYRAPASSYAPRSFAVGQQYNSVRNVAPSRGYVAPGHAGNFVGSYRVAPGRFIPGSPFRYGRWNGGFWRGAFWPRVWWGANFPWFLPAIPAFAAAYWWDSIPYYYYNDVYYTYDPSANGYVVTTPPPAQDAGDADQSAAAQPDPNGNYPIPPGNFAAPQASGQAAPVGGGLFAYPKNGQSDEQQAADRQECEQWAGGQTGGNGSSNSPDYQRALTACLQGRGYSVD
jgi:hypothetical protein